MKTYNNSIATQFAAAHSPFCFVVCVSYFQFIESVKYKMLQFYNKGSACSCFYKIHQAFGTFIMTRADETFFEGYTFLFTGA